MKAFNQPLSFDTSSVTDMQGMFQAHYRNFYSSTEKASAFNQPLSFDTSKVTNMADMFYARKSSMSAANELFIRCAWASTSAFVHGPGTYYRGPGPGYDSSWGSGSCP